MPVKVTGKAVKSANKIAEKVARKSKLGAPVYSLLGKEVGVEGLPKEVFGQEVNEQLLLQALRVYLSNEKGVWGHTKTRGEVRGSTRKIYKQKGTGRARHGAITAPIFVGGGVAFGPRKRDVSLELPLKMRRKALVGALSKKQAEGKVVLVEGLEKASGKTKQMAKWTSLLGGDVLLAVGDEKLEKARLAVRNLEDVSWMGVGSVSALDVLRHKSLVLTKDAVAKLEGRLKNA